MAVTRKKKTVERTKPVVFRYWDGTVERGVDTFRLLSKLKSGMTEETKFLSARAEQNDIESTMKMVKFFRDLFEIPEYEEINGVSKGLTDPEMLGLVTKFVKYLDDTKKSMGSLLT
jgi:hypothetical protein